MDIFIILHVCSSESDFKEDLTSYRTPVKNKRQKNPSGSRAKTKKNLTKDSG